MHATECTRKVLNNLESVTEVFFYNTPRVIYNSQLQVISQSGTYYSPHVHEHAVPENEKTEPLEAQFGRVGAPV